MKKRAVFVCNSCGATSIKWYGRCPSCGEWNTLVEEVLHEEKVGGNKVQHKAAKPYPLNKVEEISDFRYVLGSDELDGVLGGGLVPGSSVLLGGEPGIGKSTLLLQLACQMAQKHGSVLYISGEESAQQIQMRAKRLDAVSPNVYLLAENNLQSALEEAAKMDIKLLIVDSVQAVFLADLDSAPGSVSQVRACSAACLEYARRFDVSVILVGHVTKEGTLAGPRVLEHMVDTVLYFEGERYTSFRLLRAVKNRFGSTNEIGVFEMGEKGLQSYNDPSMFFLSQRPENVPGSAVTCIMQGSRPMLLEVQALVATSNFGNPRRLGSGFDYNRLLLILAVLERKLGLSLGNKDVYINIAGGMKIDDPGADLAVAAAIVSSMKEIALEERLLVIGEVGLLGEVRSIGQMARRLKEGEGFGFKTAVVPKSCEEKSKELRLIKAVDMTQALSFLGLI